MMNNHEMNNVPTPKGINTLAESLAKQRESMAPTAPNAGEPSEEVRKSLAEVGEMLTQDEWDAKIRAAKMASGDINAMIEDAGPVNDGDKALDGNEFIEGEDVNLEDAAE